MKPSGARPGDVGVAARSYELVRDNAKIKDSVKASVPRGAIQSDAAMLSIRESREAWHMAAAKLSDEAFSAILEAHPGDGA
jgi:hypothetical protein